MSAKTGVAPVSATELGLVSVMVASEISVAVMLVGATTIVAVGGSSGFTVSVAGGPIDPGSDPLAFGAPGKIE